MTNELRNPRSLPFIKRAIAQQYLDTLLDRSHLTIEVVELKTASISKWVSNIGFKLINQEELISTIDNQHTHFLGDMNYIFNKIKNTNHFNQTMSLTIVDASSKELLFNKEGELTSYCSILYFNEARRGNEHRGDLDSTKSWVDYIKSISENSAHLWKHSLKKVFKKLIGKKITLSYYIINH